MIEIIEAASSAEEKKKAAEISEKVFGSEEFYEALSEDIADIQKKAAAEAYERGYTDGYTDGREEGYDEGCMDMLDEELGEGNND